jgi:hypothetical protein
MFKNFKVDNARRVEFEGQHIQIPKSKWAYLRGFNQKGKSEQVVTETSPSPEVSSPINSVPYEHNVISCGKNLFEVGIASDYTKYSASPFLIDNNTISTTIVSGASTHFFKNTYYPNRVMYLSAVFSLPVKRLIIRCFDENKNNISSTAKPTDWSYNSYYNAIFIYADLNKNLLINIPNTAVKYIQVGFALSGDDYIGQTVIISDIMLTFGDTPVDYESYTGTALPRSVTDIAGNNYDLRSLPDGTADEVDWDNYLLQPRVKLLEFNNTSDLTGWHYYNLGYDDKCWVYYQDTSNAWGSNLGYTLNVRCNNAQVTITETINKLQVIRSTGHTNLTYIQTNTALGINAEDTNEQKTAKAQAWIASQIAQHGNIEFEYPYGDLSMPEPIPLRKYGETYDGQVWDYNAKVIQVESDVANVYTDAAVQPTLKFKAVSYGG